MSYSFDFSVVWQHAPELLRGAGLTLLLSVETMILGLLIGLICAVLQAYAVKPVRTLIATWIEVTRNTPLLIQLFLIYFGLPQFGIILDANIAAVIGLSLYLGAFSTEIIRAGLQSIPSGQTEAGLALGLGRFQILRHVLFVPALYAVAPSLAGQFVIVMLTSSVVSTISADELASITNGLQTVTFRPFEFYVTASAIYLSLALAFRAAHRLAVQRFLSFGQNGY